MSLRFPKSIFYFFQIVLPLMAQSTQEDHSRPTNLDSSSPVPTPDVLGSGFVAEWEYEEEKDLNGIQLELNAPSPRLGPATWTDSSGIWWVFGGQSPSNGVKNQSGDDFLGDLWAFNLEGSRKWTPIFQPVHETPTPLSSYPENIRHQILCGSVAQGHLAVFGGLDRSGPRESDPLLKEDNTVWLYDIPGRQPNQDGLWTSYICCDACLPTDINATLEFCPHFDQSRLGDDGALTPLVWCSTDAIMTVQLVGNGTTGKTTHLDWWKFHLGSTEWIKVPENQSGINITTLFHPQCRTTSDEDLAYILCPPGQGSEPGHARTMREVYVVDTSTNSIRWISRLTLNVAIDEEGLWENGGSVLAAIKSSDQTLLLIAYKKLLDFWLHDHSSGKFQPLENIWKGGSLNYWQHTRGFYHLLITFPSSNFTKTIYLPNPRSPLLNLDRNESRIFHVRIKPDTGVFLPMRDDRESILESDTGGGGPGSNWPPPIPNPSSSESQRKFNSEENPIIPEPTNPSRITTSSSHLLSLGPRGHNESMDMEELRGKLDPNSTSILPMKLKSNLNLALPQKVQKSTPSLSSHQESHKDEEEIGKIPKVPAVLHIPLQREKTIERGNESNLLIGTKQESHLEETAAVTETKNITLPTDSTTVESGTTVQTSAAGESMLGTHQPTLDNVLQSPENHKRVKRKIRSRFPGYSTGFGFRK